MRDESPTEPEVPPPQRPQSVVQASGFETPQVSVPSQKESPQLWRQSPAGQLPLRQARLVVQGAPAGRLPPMQKPKLQMPLVQFGRAPGQSAPVVQVSLQMLLTQATPLSPQSETVVQSLPQAVSAGTHRPHFGS